MNAPQKKLETQLLNTLTASLFLVRIVQQNDTKKFAKQRFCINKDPVVGRWVIINKVSNRCQRKYTKYKIRIRTPYSSRPLQRITKINAACNFSPSFNPKMRTIQSAYSNVVHSYCKWKESKNFSIWMFSSFHSCTNNSSAFAGV